LQLLSSSVERLLEKASYLPFTRTVGSGSAPGRSGIGADASIGVTRARFALQLTLSLKPELDFMAFPAAVLHPEFVGTLSYLSLCVIRA
jgi:hypothetical protein